MKYYEDVIYMQEAEAFLRSLDSKARLKILYNISKTQYIRDIELFKKLAETIKAPILAEGKINTPEDLAAVYEAGAYSAVVGGAITRPKQITERFVKALKK